MPNLINRKYLYNFLPLFLAILASSCLNEEPSASRNSNGENSLLATIDNNFLKATRASIDPQDDWSVVSFSNNDKIGLYAKTGNMDGDGFINAPMMFSRSVSGTFQFDNPDLNMDRSKFGAYTTMFYYPYSPDMEQEGMLLRSQKNGVDRCIDVLMMGNLNPNDLSSKLQLSGNFHHLFSELIIVRGEGFENANKKDITVVLNGGYTRLKFIDNPATNGTEVRNMWKIPNLYFDENDGLTQEESRRWMAWKGDDFKPYEGVEPKEAYYVMLPNIYEYRITGGQNTLISHPAVDYIEIYDNNDELQKISSFTLNGETKQILNGKRYPLEIKMEGLVPTIYPYIISPWDDTQDKTDERTIGIRSESEFEDWMLNYNQYTSETNGNNYDDKLLLYGDKHVNETTGEVTWYFYILNDLDFSQYKNKNIRISKLTDVIDGMGNQISNINLEDSFIGEISGNGCLSNLSIRGLSVNNSTKTNSAQGIGAVTDILSENGSIINCSVDATLKASCKVGLMAGEVTGGDVDGCTFSGLLIGSGSSASPYRYLIALDPSSGVFSLKDTDFSGIIFSQIK